MAQRNSEYPREARDKYETPEWVTEAVLPHLPFRFPRTICEPAAGSGKISRVLEKHGHHVYSCDIQNDKCLNRVIDFADLTDIDSQGVVTNPPYNQAEFFCKKSLALTKPHQGFVAMLLRANFEHAKTRCYLFRDHPAFSKKVVLTRRIVWFVEDDGKPKAAPSENHAWFIWDWEHSGPPTIAFAP